MQAIQFFAAFTAAKAEHDVNVADPIFISGQDRTAQLLIILPDGHGNLNRDRRRNKIHLQSVKYATFRMSTEEQAGSFAQRGSISQSESRPLRSESDPDRVANKEG
jgi:hypothetical protein